MMGLFCRSEKRLACLKSLYDVAIRKLRTNRPDEALEMAAWRRQVWELGQAEFPTLPIRDLGPTIWKDEYWVYMSYPKKYTLIYKTYRKGEIYTESMVDLQLAGRGGDVEDLRVQYAESLKGTNITVEKTGKSASFRLEVPLIEPPVFDKAKVREALQTAQFLKDWWENANQPNQ